jgi:RNA polymerase sigma-70 factor (ECF subfamily)
MFERPVFAVALRTVHDRQRAEEVTQDAFLKVWRNASRFDPERGAVSSWIFTIAKRSAIDAVRKQSRAPVPTETLPETTEPATDEISSAWEVNLAISQLPDHQRDAVDLFIVAGLKHTEIADRLDIPLGTVKTRIYGGLKRLRSHLEASGLAGASS